MHPCASSSDGAEQRAFRANIRAALFSDYTHLHAAGAAQLKEKAGKFAHHVTSPDLKHVEECKVSLQVLEQAVSDCVCV